jgi:hypothetical protein
MTQHMSEIARLKVQILTEYEAGQRGLEGLAQGTAQHQFINQRVENMARCHTQLIALEGPEQASKLLAEGGL